MSMKLGKDAGLSREDRRCVHSRVSIPALTRYFKGDPTVRDDRIPLVWFLALHQSTRAPCQPFHHPPCSLSALAAVADLPPADTCPRPHSEDKS